MNIKAAVSTLDALWGLRKRPLGWFVLAILLLASGLWARGLYSEAAEWKADVDVHLKTHAPEAVRQFQGLQHQVERLDDRTQRIEASVDRIEDVLMRREGKAR